MALKYSIRHEDSLIRVVAVGTPDYLSISRLWRDIVARCRRHNCLTVLGESRTERWLDTYAYDHAAIFQAVGLSKHSRIAWVEKNREAREIVKLAEAVVRNRGFSKARVFDRVADARRWLAEESDNNEIRAS